ncbi:MAG: ABC-type transport auxiliary lipoprotein family protein [Acidobacteriia bacterium]|nr:membrane integrity-associated transporter subunit PqiC [Methyloceanibacter sp.]MCL6491504.1 ABC-type transport auxiliary lipoprotein family protein [Terriglobia bacterium]
MRAPALAVAAALLLGGCTLLAPPRPEPAREVLDELPKQIPSERRHTAALFVLPPEAGPAYDTIRIAYRERPYQLGYFRDHEWAEPPAQMIKTLLIETLKRTGAFRSVLTEPDFASPTYTLRTEILELVQDYTRSPPVARLALRLELLAPTGRPLASREITREQPMQAATPYAGVAATNHALAGALAEAASFVLDHTR